ncbi:MAG: HD domain-containing protein [Euryarchaeota archaeon]|nr:HD domain-containing protein [Euryarchaeota archaeon]
MSRPQTIHDPVHKTILLSPLEQMLIDTPQMQRLRSIQQLGLADVVYPGANHTRFEHSIGTMHVASLLAKSLGLEQEDVMKVRVAGLLHDVGHSAFSHAVESVLERDPDLQPVLDGVRLTRHEVFTSHITRTVFPADNAIYRRVEEDFGVDPFDLFDEISRIATGDAQSIERPYLAQLISGDIDADRIDFLLRDSYHTGISLGLIDVDQIIQSLGIRDGNMILGSGDDCSYGEDMALTAAESMLIARAHHYTAIIHHPLTQSVRTMFLNALEDALSSMRQLEGDEAARGKVAKFFTEYNDADLTGFVQRYGGEQARRLLKDIREGTIYTPVFRFNQKTLAPMTRMALSTIARHGVARKMFEKELEKRLGDVLVDLSVATGVPKSTRVLVAGEENFFYDESALANGLVRAISRQLSLTAFAHPDAAMCQQIGATYSHIHSLVDELSPRLLSFIREEQYLSIEGLVILFYAIHSIFEEEKGGYVSIPRIRNITWLYRTVRSFGADDRLRFLFDYRFHERYGFTYSDKVFEDIQVLVAMGIVDEDLRYFEKDNRFKQRYEYVLTDDGVRYGQLLSRSYDREFRMLVERLTIDKHSIPRDIVTIPVSRYRSKQHRKVSGVNK